MPKFQTEFPLENVPFSDFIASACSASEQLKWTITYISESGVTLESPVSLKKNTWGEEITITRAGDMAILKSKSKGNTLIDFGRNRKNIDALLEKIQALKTSGSDTSVEQWKLQVAEHQQQGEDDFLNPNSKAAKEQKKWWKFLLPTKHFLITPLLIDINILLFLLMLIDSRSFKTIMLPDSELLIRWGANYKPNTVTGEWWRLVTCMFEHIGVIHLLLNMYALLYVGIFLEPLLGKLRFTVAYFVTGITASLCSLWWHDNAASAGASGAIFGMYGVFLALLLTDLIEKQTRTSLLKSIGIFIGLNLFLGISAGFVDNAAHIGGLLSGVLVGFVLYLSLKKRQNKLLETLLSGLLLGAVVLAAIIVIPRVKNPIGKYIEIMTRFSEYEANALKIYSWPETVNKADYVAEITNNTIPYLDSCRQQVEILSKESLPENLSQKIPYYESYLNLRMQEAKLRKKAKEEETDIYNTEIAELVKKIDEVVAALK